MPRLRAVLDRRDQRAGADEAIAFQFVIGRIRPRFVAERDDAVRLLGVRNDVVAEEFGVRTLDEGLVHVPTDGVMQIENRVVHPNILQKNLDTNDTIYGDFGQPNKYRPAVDSNRRGGRVDSKLASHSAHGPCQRAVALPQNGYREL